MVHIALPERRAATRKKEVISILKNFLRQSQSSPDEPEPKKAKTVPFEAECCRLPIG